MFNIGQEVVCVRDTFCGMLLKGNKYTVEGFNYDKSHVRLDGVPGYYPASRFKEAPSAAEKVKLLKSYIRAACDKHTPADTLFRLELELEKIL